MSYPELNMLIAGEWTKGTSGKSEPVICPADGSELGQLPHASAADLDDALASSKAGFDVWRKMTALQRQVIFEKAASLLDERFDMIAANLTREMGKPVGEAGIELRVAIDLLRWYGEEGKRLYGRTIPSRIPGMRHEVQKFPIGPVVAFVAWNFPATNVMRKVAGALATGCSITIKPSEETPATAIAIGKALVDAGLPAGALNIVFGVPSDVSEHLLGSPIPRKLSFTGSVPVGIHLQQLAARNMIRCTMELGGHSPVMVFEDADIEQAAMHCVAGKFRNAGQVCISPTRFMVQEGAHDAFVAAFKRAVEALQVGNGLDKGVNMGPLVAERRIDVMNDFVNDAISQGATLVTGGAGIQSPGSFFAPTLLRDVPVTAKIMTEEPFGPVAPTATFKSLDEVIERANSLPFGLAAYGFSTNPKTVAALKSEIETGMLAINSMHVHSVETPFGGVKHSGYGSEGGTEGLDAFLTVKYSSEIY
ncbi:MAG: aldehyde dehydrogenase family protein [Bacteroidetes bacterium]|jgi:succinate-semialdehyde dehydrogenase/glutarate-semialdehyde dehydrogenase|nr:aldehyde dehydrogenase family protein [Bacteroidota bacterium]